MIPDIYYPEATDEPYPEINLFPKFVLIIGMLACSLIPF
jgi:hypothetical protein